MLPEIGSSIYIRSFKHNGKLHRTWAKGFVIESNENRIVAVTNKAWVIDAGEKGEGRKWVTREPAICFFYPDRWYNVICMIRKTGIHYYCNLASPSICDEEGLKNIDYDLDVKVSPAWKTSVLDEDEYEEHKKEMGYSKELDSILWRTLDKLLKDVEERHSPFNEDEIKKLYHLYLEMIK